MVPSHGWQVGAGSSATGWCQGLWFFFTWSKFPPSMKSEFHGWKSERVRWKLCWLLGCRLTKVVTQRSTGFEVRRWRRGKILEKPMGWNIWLQPFLKNRDCHILCGNCLNLGLQEVIMSPQISLMILSWKDYSCQQCCSYSFNPALLSSVSNVPSVGIPLRH